MKFPKILTVSILAIGAASLPASAEPGKGRGQGQGHGKGASAAADRYDGAQRQYSRLGEFERDIVRDYYGNGADCPPGLAKKNNGCLPPGIAKKRYEVGSRLGDEVYVERLPYELERRLPILPTTYGYRLLDGDLGVVELATLMVVDALVF